MSMDDYNKAKELLTNIKEGSFIGPRKEALVLKAENALGIKFPPTYRKFLLDFGCGDIFGNEIYGIIQDNFDKSTVPNGIWLTLDERKTANLPKNLILIAQGYDGYLALDSNQKNSLDEYPIIEWIGGNPNNTNEIIYTDFGKYLLEILTQK
jgi:hypothetical protein